MNKVWPMTINIFMGDDFQSDIVQCKVKTTKTKQKRKERPATTWNKSTWCNSIEKYHISRLSAKCIQAPQNTMPSKLAIIARSKPFFHGTQIDRTDRSLCVLYHFSLFNTCVQSTNSYRLTSRFHKHFVIRLARFGWFLFRTERARKSVINKLIKSIHFFAPSREI